MTTPEPAGKTAQSLTAPCEGGFRCHRPYGHASATVRLSFRMAGNDRTQLYLLCDGCAEVAQDALIGNDTVMARQL